MPDLNDTNANVGGGFGNDSQLVTVRYDFDEDTGGQDDYVVFTADKACVVELSRMDIRTAGTSGGSMVMDLGKGAGGTEFKSDLAVASMTLDAQINADTVGTKVLMAAGETIQMGIETADLTAGKFDFVFEIFARE